MTLLFTYSGIGHIQLEPFPSAVAEASLRTAASLAQTYRAILYWRPLVSGLNDTVQHLAKAVELSNISHATVFTGLFYRNEIAQFYKDAGLPEPYSNTARRKILPEDLERRILDYFEKNGGGPLFRKTSCAVSFVHGLPDYNGHFGLGEELCGICPLDQIRVCSQAHQMPTKATIHSIADQLPEAQYLGITNISDRAAVVTGLTDEQPRYFLQHALRFQIHDDSYPHLPNQHGRAVIGWNSAKPGAPST